MEQLEFERAITSPNFITAYCESMKEAEGVTVIDASATSGSVLMLRFLFAAPAWMRPRHVAFDLLGRVQSERAAYLSYCAIVSPPEGEVPRRLATHRLIDVQSDSFWGCNWDELDMVYSLPDVLHEGGFLALRYLDTGTRYNHVAKDDFYTVESPLMGIRDRFGNLLLGIAFNPAPGEGYSLTDIVDRQS
ncbi:MAG: hypothetical protein SGPRY_004804 [Prymnesium sp.]